jgi:hypothetical protein
VDIFALVVEPTIPGCIHAIDQGDRRGIRKRIEMGGIATMVIVGMRVTTDGVVIVGTSGVVTTTEISRHEEGRIGSFSICPSSLLSLVEVPAGFFSGCQTPLGGLMSPKFFVISYDLVCLLPFYDWPCLPRWFYFYSLKCDFILWRKIEYIAR